MSASADQKSSVQIPSEALRDEDERSSLFISFSLRLSLLLTSGRKLPRKVFRGSFYDRYSEYPCISGRLKCFPECKLAYHESVLVPTSVTQPVHQISIAPTLFSLRLPVAYDAPAHTVSRALNACSPLLPKSLKEKKHAGGGGGREGRKEEKRS